MMSHENSYFWTWVASEIEASKHSEIVLEDKAIYGLNKVHKNVLRSNPTDFQYNAKVSDFDIFLI